MVPHAEEISQGLRQDVKAAVVALWERCQLTRPWNDPRKDIRRKLHVRPDLLLVGDCDGEIVATVMVGYEGHRGWVNYLAVAPEHRRKGFGRLMMAEAERLLVTEVCPKVNLQVREGNESAIKFCQALDYSVDKVISMGRRLEKDDVT